MTYTIDAIIDSHFNKETSVKRLQKFWINFCKSHEVDMHVFTEEGNLAEYWLDFDQVDASIVLNDESELDSSNFIDSLFQDRYIYGQTPVIDTVNNAGNEKVCRVTLDDLYYHFLENEVDYNVRQFNIIPTKVHGIVDKIIADRQLYETIELGYVEGKAPIFVSGRHRACALLTIFRVVEGWENLEVCVKIAKYPSEQYLLNVIETRNGSRAMSVGEKGFLALGKKGIDPNDPDEIFKDVKSGLTALPRVYEAYFMTMLDAQALGITTATAGAIGRKIGSLLKGKHNNQNVLPPQVRKFLKDPAIVKEIAQTCVQDGFENQDNWKILKERCKKTEKDAEGNEIVTFNVSRNVDKIAVPLAKSLAKEFETQLSETLVQQEAEKQAKAKKAKVSEAEKQAKKLEAAKALLRAQGITSL